MNAPAFAHHFVHKNKSIHVSIALHGIGTTSLIDCGAIDNFFNRAFMRKRGLRAELSKVPRTYKLGEGVTLVTHSLQSEVEVSGKKFHFNFFVMNGRSC